MFASLPHAADPLDLEFIATAYIPHYNGRTTMRNELEEALLRGLGGLRGDVSAQAWSPETLDSVMAGDLWAYTARILQKQLLREPPYEITALIASGEEGLGLVYKGMRDFLRHSQPELALRLHTFAWKESLASVMAQESKVFEPLEKLDILHGAERKLSLR